MTSFCRRLRHITWTDPPGVSPGPMPKRPGAQGVCWSLSRRDVGTRRDGAQVFLSGTAAGDRGPLRDPRNRVRPILLSVLMVILGSLHAADWQIDHPADGVLVLRNETGAWGGFSMGVSHINTPRYQARKTFDLRALPAGAVARAKAARLRF